MTIIVASQTHPGQLREENQDHVLGEIRPAEQGQSRALLIVADGLGGHNNGALAAATAVATLREKFNSFLTLSDAEDTQPINLAASDDAVDLTGLVERLQRAIQAANTEVAKLGEGPDSSDERAPASTLVAAVIQGSHAVLAHAGDSRAYLLRGKEFTRLTQDHSFVGELIRANKLPESAVYDHPRRNMVLRALGQEEEVEPEIQTLELQPGDKLMLCSDGLWGMVEQPEKMLKILKDNAPQKACKKLIDLANKLGGEDNISVVIAEIG